MAGKTSSRAPPFLKEGDSYSMWKHKLLAWEILTDLPKEKMGIAVYLNGLDESYQKIVSKIQIADLNEEDGLKTLLKQLDKYYESDKADKCYYAYERLFNYRRKPNQTVLECLVEFDLILNEFLSLEMTLPTEVLAFHVLNACGLSKENNKLARATILGLNYENMVDQIKKIVDCNVSQSNDNLTCNKFEDSCTIKVERDSQESFYTKGKSFSNRGTSYSNRWRGRGGAYNSRRELGNTEKSDRPWSSDSRQCYSCGSPEHLVNSCPSRKCFRCRKTGHFANECPRNGVNYIENSSNNSNTENDNNEAVHITLWQSPRSDITSFVGETLGYGILDTGCTSTVCGRTWLQEFMKTLTEKELTEVKEKPCKSYFRFGDGVEVESTLKVTLPIAIGKKNASIEVAVVDKELPLLLSRASMERGAVRLHFDTKIIHILGQQLPLEFTSSGHPCIPLTRRVVRSSDNGNIVLHVKSLQTLKPKQKLEKASKLHRQLSHASKEALIRLLKSSGIDDKELFDAVDKVTSDCDICLKYKRKPSRPCVSLPRTGEFNSLVALDLKTYIKDKVYILHMIDECTRYSAACVIFSKQQEEIVKKVLHIWIRYFGAPRCLLSDNGGEFSNESVREMCEKFNMVNKTTPGESPWSNGVVERHNAILMEAVNKTMEDTGCDLETALSWSISAKNSLSNVSGYSPNQLVFGKNPNFPSILNDDIPALESCSTSEVVRRTLNAIHCARNAFVSSESSERVRRALRMKLRTCNDTLVNNGDEVYYRRNNVKGWRGPGIVIGRDNNLVIVRHGGVFYRVPVCDILVKPVRSENKCKSEGELVNGNQLESEVVSQSGGLLDSDDVSDSGDYVANEVVEAYDSDGESNGDNGVVNQEVGNGDIDVVNQEEVGNLDGPRIRAGNNVNRYPQVNSTVKFQPVNSNTWMTATILSKGGKATGRNKDYLNVKVVGEDDPRGIHWDSHVQEWETVDAVENVLLLTKTSELSEKVIKAKDAEVQNWIRNNVFTKVEDNGQRTISARWVITEKESVDSKGSCETKTKARIVARGYEEDSSQLTTDSPTCVRESLRLVFCTASSFGWDCTSLDVKAAFLQGYAIDRELYLKPPKDIREPGIIWKLNRCPYGLNDAPRAWYNRVNAVLIELGCKISIYDEALYYYHKESKFCGLLALYVDDFLVAGNKCFKVEVVDKLVSTFEISVTKCENFKYIGLNVIQSHKGISIDQDNYINALQLIHIPTESERPKDDPLTKSEKDMVRKYAGRLLWVANGTRPDISFDACQISNVGNSGTVSDLVRINKVIKKMKTEFVSVQYPDLGPPSTWKIVAYSDASHANLPDGSSQCGFIVFILSEGGRVAPMIWNSKKIHRVAKSTLVAETLAFIECAEAAFLLQMQIKEVFKVSLDVECRTDNKSLFDTVQSKKVITDRRLRVDIALLRQMVRNKEISIEWVNHKNQLADAFTKQGASSHCLMEVIRTSIIKDRA